VVIVVAAWMLDSVTCAGMGFAAPRVAVSALVELGGFRRSSRDDPTIVQGEQDEKPADTDAATRSLAPAQHSVRLRKAAGDEPLGAQHSTHPVDRPPAGGDRRRARGA
jgi:hypothetical protein